MQKDRRMMFVALLLISVIVIAACQPTQVPPPQPSPAPAPQPPPPSTECTADSECFVGGCSGEVCTTAAKAAEGLVTTCEYRAEYACYKLTSCGCVSGKCGWIENPGFEKCVQQNKDKKTVY